MSENPCLLQVRVFFLLTYGSLKNSFLTLIQLITNNKFVMNASLFYLSPIVRSPNRYSATNLFIRHFIDFQEHTSG